MRVGGPGVRGLDAAHQRPAILGDRGPQTERAVDVHPSVARVGRRADLVDRVERAAVHVPRLRADDQRRVVARARARRASASGAHAPLLVGGNPLGRRVAEAQVAERDVDRRVPLLADHDAHGRRAVQAPGRDVPADVGEHAVPRRGERGEVGHHPAGDEPDRRCRREARAGRAASGPRSPRSPRPRARPRRGRRCCPNRSSASRPRARPGGCRR